MTTSSPGRLPTRPRCWQCAQLLDGYVGMTGWPEPGSGDVSMCGSCSALGVFVSSPYGLTVRRPTVAEAERFMSDPDVVELIDTANRVRGLR